MSRKKIFNAYDPFAWLYNRYWGEEFHHEALPVLDRLILHLLPSKAEVLDLCCGDGRIAASLAQRGYRVTGIDGSEQMLAFARQRTNRVDFRLADARDFSLPPRFDAVISTFDSLNHVLKTDDLAKVFSNVFACLKPGGHFAFDLNREEAYTDLWSRTASTVDKAAVSVARGSYDRNTGIAVCNVTLLRPDGECWKRSDFRLMQKHHPRADVLRLLQAAGFDASVHDAQLDLGMQGDIGVGRDFYLAAKPGA